MKNITLKGRPNFQPPLPIGPCVHRWRLGEQCGTPTVPGVCGKCGAEKEFRLGSDYYTERDFSNRYSR